MKKIALGFILGFIMAVPSVALAQKIYDTTLSEVRRGSSGYVHRWDDPDFQIKCWEMKDGYSGGLSCLPWPQVRER